MRPTIVYVTLTDLIVPETNGNVTVAFITHLQQPLSKCWSPGYANKSYVRAAVGCTWETMTGTFVCFKCLSVCVCT